MPVYRLEPIEGTEKHHRWRESVVPPVPVWVQATSPHHARQKMHLATIELPASIFGAKLVDTPWTDDALVKCIEDASHDVPRNVAILANGKITLKIPIVEKYWKLQSNRSRPDHSQT